MRAGEVREDRASRVEEGGLSGRGQEEETMMSTTPAVSKLNPGRDPSYEVDDFPAPPRDLNFRKLMAVLGPAVIALGGTIGGGGWLVGPALFVKWGLALLWITTVSSLL
jgi:hypothetical protein